MTLASPEYAVLSIRPVNAPGFSSVGVLLHRFPAVHSWPSGHLSGSNGPIFVPKALAVVEQEFRETLALSYLLLRLGWPTYLRGPGPKAIITGPRTGWERYEGLLRTWLPLDNL